MELGNFIVNKLRIKVFSDRYALGAAAADDAAARINRIIEEKGEATVVFAAAPSQNELLSHLCEREIDWTRVRAMHQDEYIGIDPSHPACFGNFMRRSIFEKKPFMATYCFQDIGGKPEETVLAYTRLVEKYPPDLIFLGVGENGHLAFNDPGEADFKDPYKIKIVELDEKSRAQQVNDGCFSALGEVPLRAYTMTMSLIMSIPQKIVCVPGIRKAEAVKALLSGPVSELCPASALKLCGGATMYLDSDSFSLTAKSGQLLNKPD